MDTTRKLWWGLSTLLIVTFAIMLWMGLEIHQQAPPLPSKIEPAKRAETIRPGADRGPER